MGSQSLATLEQSTWVDLLWFSLVGDARDHLSLPVRSLPPHCPRQVPTSPLSPRLPSGPYLLHELPKLSAPTISGAGALCRDHSRADAFAIGCLGGGVELPALFWTLEESLQTNGCSQRGGTQRGPSTLLGRTEAFCQGDGFAC